MFYKSVTNDITMLLFLYMLSVLTLFHVFLLLYIVFFRGCWSYYGSVWGREKICFATFPVWFIQWSHSKQYTPNPFMQLTSERNVKKKSRVDCKINPIFLHDKRHKLNKKKLIVKKPLERKIMVALTWRECVCWITTSLCHKQIEHCCVVYVDAVVQKWRHHLAIQLTTLIDPFKKETTRKIIPLVFFYFKISLSFFKSASFNI